MKHDFFGQLEARMSEMVQQAHRVNANWLGDYETLLKNQDKRPDLIQRSLLALDAPGNPANPTEGSAVEVSGSVVDQALLACNLRSPTEWEQRIMILRHSQEWWREFRSLKRMPPLVRKALSGVHKNLGTSNFMHGVDWHLFGHMIAANNPVANILVNENNRNLASLSAAMDEIPHEGEISEAHYERFLKCFLPLHESVSNPGIATTSRLLALKRPDVFMPVTSANRARLKQALNLKPSDFKLQGFRNLMVRIKQFHRIQYPQKFTLSSDEEIAEFSQMALLDAVFYKEKQKPEKKKPLRP